MCTGAPPLRCCKLPHRSGGYMGRSGTRSMHVLAFERVIWALGWHGSMGCVLVRFGRFGPFGSIASIWPPGGYNCSPSISSRPKPPLEVVHHSCKHTGQMGWRRACWQVAFVHASHVCAIRWAPSDTELHRGRGGFKRKQTPHQLVGRAGSTRNPDGSRLL